MVPRLCWLPCLLSWLACGLSVGFAAAGDPLRQVWALAADSQVTEAQVALERSRSAETRERLLAVAVLALARPPVAESELRRIEQELARLAQGDDDLAARALYLQARIHQIHLPAPDLERAAALYRELARRWPRSHWAQLGLVKLGCLQLYSLPEPADPVGRLAAAVRLLDGIAEAPLRRDLQLQISWAALDWDRPLAEVLPHLLAADAVGGLLGMTAEDLVAQIGELSFRQGDFVQARRFLQRFLDEFPTSNRRFNVRMRLVEAEARLASPSSGGVP